MTSTDTSENSGRATRSDLAEQDFDKVFATGFASDRTPEEAQESRELIEQATSAITPRPAFGISAAELDAAKMMAMAGPLIPEWLRHNPGHCWGLIQLSKRWTRFDPRTNSWIHFDPITIAQASYLVNEGGKNQSVAFMSVFIRALVDAFAPLKTKMRFEYDGDGQERTCRAFAVIKGETEPHVYVTPPLRLINPKRSPLWQSDPDRQLAYYASRAWARLYCAGVLHGVYDEDELDTERGVSDATEAAAALHKRLAVARAESQEDRGGFRDGAAEQAISGETGPKRAAGKPAGAPKEAGARVHSPRKAKRTGGQRRGRTAAYDPALAPSEHIRESKAAEARKTPAKQPEPPKNLGQYRAHVRRWLMECETEEQIEAQWRSEMKLRNLCQVTADDKIVIRADLIDQRIADLRKA